MPISEKITTSLLALLLLASGLHGQAVFRGQNVPASGGGGGVTATFQISTFVAETSSGSASITTVVSGCPSVCGGPITVTAGWLVHVYCRDGDGTGGAIVATDSEANSWTPETVQFQTGSPLTAQGSWSVIVHGGSDNFTCTPTATQNFQSMVVVAYSGSPAFSSTDGPGTGSNAPSSATGFVSTSFSTTTKGLIIVCATRGSTSSSGFTAGLIGGVAGTLRQSSQSSNPFGDAACEDLITSSAQTSITGAMSWSIATGWGATVSAFH